MAATLCGSVTVPDVYRSLWRHKFLIVAASVLLVGAAWFATSRQQRIYQASSLVRIQQRVVDPGEAFGALQTGGRLARTYAEITSTSTIARRIYEQLDRQVPLAEIETSLSAHQISDLELLSIRAKNPNPRNAQLIANAAPDALRQFISQTGTFRDQVIIVERAVVPTSPSSPSLRQNVLIALLLALVLNAGLALLLETFNQRVRDEDDLERLTGKPVLASVPILDLKRASATAITARRESPEGDRSSAGV